MANLLNKFTFFSCCVNSDCGNKTMLNQTDTIWNWGYIAYNHFVLHMSSLCNVLSYTLYIIIIIAKQMHKIDFCMWSNKLQVGLKQNYSIYEHCSVYKTDEIPSVPMCSISSLHMKEPGYYCWLFPGAYYIWNT